MKAGKPARHAAAKRKQANTGEARRQPRGLHGLLLAAASPGVRIVDLTQTLSPDFPPIVLPPEMGQSRPFRMEEISRYDDRGPAWYWNNVSFGEHTGIHMRPARPQNPGERREDVGRAGDRASAVERRRRQDLDWRS